VAWAEHAYGWLGEDGQPIRLADWQRAVLEAYWAHRADVSTLLISTVKKAGKTFVDSLLTSWRWLTIPSVHFVVGNDKDQSAELQITMIGAMVRRHPVLRRVCRVTRSQITLEPTGSRLVSLPMDYAGASGANFATVSLTEIWAFAYEHAQRLYEELTPIPGDCLRIIDSYAGFEGEAHVLRRVWDRGISGDLVSDEWPIYLSGGQLSYVHQGEDAQRRCWRGTDAERAAYYREQRATLRPMTYRRLHLNQWASGEEQFVSESQIDACTVSDLEPLAPGTRSSRGGATLQVAMVRHRGYGGPVPKPREPEGPELSPVVVGLDVATKQDHTGIVGLCWDFSEKRARLAWHAVFRPPVELGAVEAFLLRQGRDYTLGPIVYDPFQAQFLAQRLQAAGLVVREYLQTVPNLRRVAEALYSLINSRRLVLYRNDVIRAHLLNAHAKATGDGGYRLVKASQGRKIDLAIALAMAATVVLELYADLSEKEIQTEAAPEVEVPEGDVLLRYVGGNAGQFPISLGGRLAYVGPGWEQVVSGADAVRVVADNGPPHDFTILAPEAAKASEVQVVAV
jgi:hypothetical protein